MNATAHPTLLESISAWVLVVAFALSIVYEFWWATAKAGVSRHDSLRAFVQGLWLYVSVLVILVSIFYYNPKMMLERDPGLFDWFEDLVYTGLMFVAAALLALEVCGLALVA